MDFEATDETEASLIRINKVCRFISASIKIIFILFCICWIFAAGLMVCSIMNIEGFGDIGDTSVLRLVLYLVYGGIIAVVFIVLIRIFSDVAKGDTPFAMIQVKRLRIIAADLLLYAILDFVITYNSALLQLDGFSSGYVSTNGNAIVAVNFVPLIAAAVVFAFSFVFKYGVLLQELSDETL